MKKTAAVLVLLLAVLALTACGSGAAKKNKEGLEAYEAGNYREAVLLFQEAITGDNTNSDYYVNLGMANLAQGELEASMSNFDNALRLDPDNKKAYRGKGMAALEDGDYKDAAAFFDMALKKAEGRVTGDELDVLFYRAEAEQKQEDYDKAIETYGILIDTTKTRLAEAYTMRGICRLKAGDQSAAQADFDQAVKADSQDYTLYIAIYHAMKAEGQEEAGREYLNRALLISGNSTGAHKFRGMIQYMLGDYTHAETEFLAVKKADQETVRYLGLVYETMGQEEKAQEQYEKLLTMGTPDSAVYAYLGGHQLKNENYEAALGYFTQGIGALGDQAAADLYFGEAAALEHLGRYEEALAKFEAYIQRFGESDEVLHEIAFLKTRI